MLGKMFKTKKEKEKGASHQAAPSSPRNTQADDSPPKLVQSKESIETEEALQREMMKRKQTQTQNQNQTQSQAAEPHYMTSDKAVRLSKEPNSEHFVPQSYAPPLAVTTPKQQKSASTSSGPIVLKPFTFLNVPWYHGSITEKQAKKILRDLPLGSYLCRKSSQPNALALEFVRDGLEKVMIRYDKYFCWFPEFEQDKVTSLEDLALIYSGVLVYPVVSSHQE